MNQADTEIREGAENSPACVELALITSMTCHHLINALTGIVSQLESLATAQSRSREPSGDPTNTAVEAALSASVVARKLSDLASRSFPVVKQPVDLAVLLRSAVDRKKLSQPDGLEWSVAIDDVPTLDGDESLLVRMFDELLSNCCEAATRSEAKSISVSLAQQPTGSVWIEFSNSIAGRFDGKVRGFEPFYTSKQGHRGLGLTLVRAIWRLHKGSITYLPREGGDVSVMLRSHSDGQGGAVSIEEVARWLGNVVDTKTQAH
jgi:signal transduction histidine kinase